ncbi:MAG TPA: methionyl-tRNA formyltransferase [Methylomirabilota bacterium]|nr:methionyl-tRNA formyltransferase [Methylomirabilota bacterium]
MDAPAIPSPLNIVFFGTAPLAAVSLEALLKAPFAKVSAVVTQPDKPQGRDLKLAPSAVKVKALEAGLLVLQPIKARASDFVDRLRELAPDLVVVAAYGQILPQSILDVPRFGCLNVHASLLPRHRGAAPIQWAIAEGDPVTGVTIMKMDAGLDTGDMLTKVETPITPQDNGATLHDRLATLGADLLVQTIPGYVRGKILPQPQPATGATYARKVKKEDGFLDWRKPAIQLWNELRAFTPWPGAFTFEPSSKARLKIHSAEVAPTATGLPGQIVLDGGEFRVVCGKDSLRLLEVQREGGKRMTARDYLAGKRVQNGECFPLPS